MIQVSENSSSDAHDHRAEQPDAARPRLLAARQLAREDRDEDDVVDAEHDLEHGQRDERDPDLAGWSSSPCVRSRAWSVTTQNGQLGYHRFPALSGDTVVFTAEGDLWRVGANGGIAQRLTTHPQEESRAAVSPDGKTVAYSATYEGPGEIHTLPLDGGVPARRTHDASRGSVVGWTPGGGILFATRRHSTLPNTQLATLDPKTGARPCSRSRRRATAPTTPRVARSSSRASRSRAATRAATRGARRRTSGS